MTTRPAGPQTRDVLRNALVVLARKSGELALETAREFRARFDLRLTVTEDPFAKTSQLSASQLSLVDETTLQLEIALDKCAARLREQSATGVFQLTARVSELLGRDASAERDNPIAPRVFARALFEAIRNVGLEGEGLLAAFQAFGPALLYVLPDLYGHANALLVGRGVLAEYQASYGKPVGRPAAARARPEAIPTDARTLAALLDRLLAGKAKSIAAL